jgi:hypothetical protein
MTSNACFVINKPEKSVNVQKAIVIVDRMVVGMMMTMIKQRL